MYSIGQDDLKGTFWLLFMIREGISPRIINDFIALLRYRMTLEISAWLHCLQTALFF